jgi:ABC-type Mn2+/Zn2+ transport system permease subunit
MTQLSALGVVTSLLSLIFGCLWCIWIDLALGAKIAFTSLIVFVVCMLIYAAAKEDNP